MQHTNQDEYRVERVIVLAYDDLVEQVAYLPLALTTVPFMPTTRLVIVSAQSIAQVQQALRSMKAEIWGSGGWERLREDGTYHLEGLSRHDAATIQAAREAVAHFGLQAFCTEQPAQLTLHRHMARQTIARDIWGTIAAALTVLAHRAGCTVHIDDTQLQFMLSARDKGSLIHSLLDETPPGVVLLYVGAQASDEVAFAALRARKQGSSVLVHPRLRPSLADVWLRPADLSAFLLHWQRARMVVDDTDPPTTQHTLSASL